MGPPRLLQQLADWVQAKRECFDVRVLELCPDTGEALTDGDFRLLGVHAFVIVCSGRLAPSKALPGLGLRDAKGRFVVGSQLPITSRSVSIVLATLVNVESRANVDSRLGPALLLGEWEPRARKMALRSLRCLKEAGLSSFQWTADRVSRESLCQGLSCGAGMALYYGHGRSVGWAGYYGFRARHLPESPDEPIGTILSITCSTASRGSGGLSFSERLVSRGVCAASLGATRRTRHLSNAYLASSFCEAIASGATRLHQAIDGANLPEDLLYSSYRLFGDPTALLAGSVASEDLAGEIYAPSPEEELSRRKASWKPAVAFSPEVVREDVDLAELIGL